MKIAPFLAATILVASTFTVSVHAQDAMKKDAAPKPPDSPSKVVLDSWNEIGRKLIAMAEDFPEDKYDFKPTPFDAASPSKLLHAALGQLLPYESAHGEESSAKRECEAPTTRPRLKWWPT